MIRFALALLALLVFVPVAQAASFDCAKAGTSFEKAICDSPDLSKQDEVLAQAYATALGGLTADAAAAVKASQHNWLGYAARICSDDAQPIKDEYTADQSTCLGGEFTTRIRELEASKMQGGYRFYPVEKFLFEKSGELAAGDTSADIDVTTTVKEVTSSRITLTTDAYWYGHGAAHGNYMTRLAHFLIVEKRPLETSDVFKAKAWEKTFGKLVIDKAKADLGDEWQGDDTDGSLT